MKVFIAFTVATLLLVGCGGDMNEGIARTEAEDIAAMSQDADQHLDAFANAIQVLGGKEECSASSMREYGGFMRVTGDPLYFLYCGIPNNRSNRWYLNPQSGQLSQSKSSLL